MTLQTSGQISIGDINVELGRPRTSSNTSLHDAELGNYGTIRPTADPKPDGSSNSNLLSEWYGYSHNIVFNFVLHNGVSEGENATCTEYDSHMILAYSNYDTLNIGTPIYSDQSMTIPFSDNIYYYYEAGNSLIMVNSSGQITSMISCTTASYYGFSLSTGTSGNYNNVSSYPLNMTLYGHNSIVGIGSVMYTNSGLTTTFTGNSTVYRRFVNGDGSDTYIKISTSGVVLDVGASA